ncbi:MAG: flagellar assembly protein FliW [Candidatus Schekmanbacteria bacterium]|nr:flagellar assembly protein FliW [Candidatus Schekmanbacteria bacterium]
MIFESKNFGTLNIEDKNIVLFVDGLIGFCELKKFIILTPQEDTPFRWLQSLDNPEIVFAIINPLLFFPDYKIKITKADIDLIEAKTLEDIQIYAIVTIPDNFSKLTANLLGPIIINANKCKAKQIVVDNSSYSTKHLLLSDCR